MKNQKRLFFLLMIGSVLSISSCKKKSSEPAPAPVVTAANPPFSWSENGGTSKSTTNASFNSGAQTLQAISSDNLTVIQITLTASTPGTYPVSTANFGNDFHYTNGTYQGTSGNVIITANASGKMSGTFNTSWCCF